MTKMARILIAQLKTGKKIPKIVIKKLLNIKNMKSDNIIEDNAINSILEFTVHELLYDIKTGLTSNQIKKILKNNPELIEFFIWENILQKLVL